MDTAFQADAFQNDAFQINVTPAAPEIYPYGVDPLEMFSPPRSI